MSYNNYTLPKYPCECDMWDALSREERPVVVYGMGNGADKLIKRLERYGVQIADFFASDGFVRGHSFHGKRVKSFSEIREEYSDFVILLSFASNRPDVIEMLARMNGEYDMLVPDMPVAGEDEYFDRELYNSHYDEIKEAYDALADEDSRRAYAAVISYKLTGKMSYLLDAYSTKEELYSLIGTEVRSYVDAGAYNGDTLREAIEFFPRLERAVAIEPDPKTFKRLSRYAEGVSGVELELLNAAVSSSEGYAELAASGNRNSTVSATASYQHKLSRVPLIRLDFLVTDCVDYIKYDVEGAELDALVGTEGIIVSTAPTLLVSVYHRSRDIFSLINYLHGKYGDRYNFYLRRLFCIPAWEIALIACNKEKSVIQ